MADAVSTGPDILSRRTLLHGVAATIAGTAFGMNRHRTDRPAPSARVAITLDLEMSAQYPKRGITEWNYEKGNLDESTKKYAVEAARVAKQRGGLIHFFCVGRVLEQPDVDWLTEIAAAGHPIGNHTYDHVNVKATTPAETQFRFQRAPWLVDGMSAKQIIERNIRITSDAMNTRLGMPPNGFRTPGGFNNGLEDRPDIQQMLIDIGFSWVSSKYPAHLTGKPHEEPTEEVYESIKQAQAQAQPFVYPSGLIEVPMSPISDVTAFRSNFWKLEYFLKAIRIAVERTIETGGMFDFLAHPSCLVVEDPNFETIKLICDLVREAGDKATIVGLDKIAGGMKGRR
jgi:peptidoglycan/xylan/chitin deacetylase (PgdA/CDA1 family)